MRVRWMAIGTEIECPFSCMHKGNMCRGFSGFAGVGEIICSLDGEFAGTCRE